MAQYKEFEDLNEDVIRHYILNSLRSYRSKFKAKYGELVICCDDRSRASWRKEYFPYYKANRAKARASMPVDWGKLLQCIHNIEAEIKVTFPYPVVKVDRAEADDVIATISTMPLSGSKLIISNDKDMGQLQRYGVDVYLPIRAVSMLPISNIETHLQEHIFKGDASDGIPNVLSDDDTFVNPNKRQKPLRKTRIDELLLAPSVPADVLRNYKRNETLIDLTKIPQDVEATIKQEFAKAVKSASTISRGCLMNFFIEKKLSNLFDRIQDF